MISLPFQPNFIVYKQSQLIVGHLSSHASSVNNFHEKMKQPLD